MTMIPGYGRRDSRSRPSTWSVPALTQRSLLAISFISISLIAISFIGCAREIKVAGPTVVLVTIQPLAYFVERLAGDLVECQTLLPPGANPHSHEPGVPQLRALEEAKLLVTVGHPALAFERTIVERLPRNESLRVLDGFSGLAAQRDPHVWLSPPAARVLVQNLVRALEEVLPSEAGELAARAAALDHELIELDEEIREILGPRSDRAFLVYHDAWGSFARTYGLEQIAIEQDGHQPGPDRIAQVIERARQRSLRSIFIEPQFSRRSAELIATEVGAQVVTLDPLARDWPDNLIRVAQAIVEGSAP